MGRIPKCSKLFFMAGLQCHAIHQGTRKVTETSVIRFCHRSETLLISRSAALKLLLLSREKTVHLAKTKAITHLLQCLFNVTQRTKLEIKRALLHNQEPCRPLTLQNVMMLEGLHLMKRKLQKDC